MVPRTVVVCAFGLCVAGLAGAVGGCRSQADPPTLALRGEGAGDVFIVTHKEGRYYLCRQCRLSIDPERRLCDEQGRRVSAATILVPAAADKLYIRADGMVLAWVEDGWSGLGRVTLLRPHDNPGHKGPIPPSRRLWELGVQVIPGQSGLPTVRPVEWVLREPQEDEDEGDEPVQSR